VRLTVFWEKMRGQFGEAYAASVAKDFVLTGLRPFPAGFPAAARKRPDVSLERVRVLPRIEQLFA